MELDNSDHLYIGLVQNSNARHLSDIEMDANFGIYDSNTGHRGPVFEWLLRIRPKKHKTR